MSEQKSIYESVFGLTPPKHPSEQAMRSIFEVITGQPWSAMNYIQEQTRLEGLDGSLHAGELSPADISVTDMERIMSRHIATQLLTDGYDLSSTLFDWPDYERAFCSRGRKLEGGTAVMLGSLESISSLAFTALAKEVYGADRACIIDTMTGADKKQHGTFIMAGALEMPFQDSSVDLVHSNFAFSVLEDASPLYGNVSDQRYRMLTEAWRILKPGGQLIMCEYIFDGQNAFPPRNKDDVLQRLESVGNQLDYEFRLAGFGDAAIMPHKVPAYERALFDPQRNYGPEAVICPDNYLIFATRAV